MSEFSHLKNKLLAEQVEDEIYHYILDTPLEPGTKLPNEFELGEKVRRGPQHGARSGEAAFQQGHRGGAARLRHLCGHDCQGPFDPLNLRSVQDKNALALDLVSMCACCWNRAWPRWPL